MSVILPPPPLLSGCTDPNVTGCYVCLPGKHPRKPTRSCFPSRPESDGGHGAEREGGGEGGRRRVKDGGSKGWLTGRLRGGVSSTQLNNPLIIAPIRVVQHVILESGIQIRTNLKQHSGGFLEEVRSSF